MEIIYVFRTDYFITIFFGRGMRCGKFVWAVVIVGTGAEERTGGCRKVILILIIVIVHFNDNENDR